MNNCQIVLNNKGKPIRSSLSDGTYRVMTKYLVAGFVVKNGMVTQIAPILRNKFQYWEKVAEKIN